MATKKLSDSKFSIVAADGRVVIRIEAPFKPLKLMLATVPIIVTVVELVIKLLVLK